ncbi:heparan-alpha-glucosaminide N-acetyltransferase [Defluviimonas sp. SAOS-178_SWC]|uniref:heparan-alpha-glucosaminide N-acetyltransferase n=1 Tax=Defluviimonas sp. SAOS-178_SWC TaxID=3121287 RepID=UPI003221C8FC
MRAAERRIGVLDLARGLALVAMASFHLTYDLQLFGFLPHGTIATWPLWLYARLIAGSFIFLAGVGLWLGHGRGIRWGPFWRRFARIAAGAMLVTVATFLVDRSSYVFFGILHSIAVSSLIGLAFLRVPAALTALAGCLAIIAPHVLTSGAFDAALLGWLGLASYGIRSVDFEPTFPWVAPFLFGIAAAKVAGRRGLWGSLRALRPKGPAFPVLAWAGRHSLPIYLLHQPILFGLVWAAARLNAA